MSKMTAADWVAVFASDEFISATFGGAKRFDKVCPWVRVVVRPVLVRGVRHLQFEAFDAKQAHSKNVPVTDLDGPLNELWRIGFAGCHVRTTTDEIDVRVSKKGETFVGRRSASNAPAVSTAHNRVKEVPLPEGRADHLLQIMGIMTPEGLVRASMRSKFVQINEFIKHLIHALADTPLLTLDRPIEILDCGCGSSHLTLAVHHYLNTVLGRPARILGVDVNDAVIRKSLGKVEKLDADGVRFQCERIHKIDARADVVIALHACDTATDEALAVAVRAGAVVILAVPCCHRRLNQQFRTAIPDPAFAGLCRHPILRERLADMLTDVERAETLERHGYTVSMAEFVASEHTPRNVLIRAVKR